jgi:hypothetical protein
MTDSQFEYRGDNRPEYEGSHSDWSSLMSVSFILDSAFSPSETSDRIAQARAKYGDMLRYFWISDVREAGEFSRAVDEQYDFTPTSTFLIRWSGEHSEFIRRIPVVFFEVFGKDNILIYDDTCDPVPPPSD